MVVVWWASLAAGQSALDVNVAGEPELRTLPGIGPAKARALVVFRDETGPCRELTDLEAVPGWGPATLAALRGRIVCGVEEIVPDDTPPAPEVDVAALHTDQVDINEAGPFRLATLPGISLARANAIVEDRSTRGPFASCDDLSRIPGLGVATVSVLADRCKTSR